MPRRFVRESPTHVREISPVERPPSPADLQAIMHGPVRERFRCGRPPILEAGIPERVAPTYVPPVARAARSF
jgi:hypothetical protein